MAWLARDAANWPARCSGWIRAGGSSFTAGRCGPPARGRDKGGARYCAEDRLNEGDLCDALLPEQPDRGGIAADGAVRVNFHSTRAGCATRAIREFQVKLDTPEQPINTLSGGNQQKLVLGRWLETEPEVLILDEPTRGVDVGAKAQIHRIIGELAAKGKAILLISSELPEVRQMSDRVLVLSEGRLAGEFDPRKVGEDTLVAAALPE